jgi:hypothetical protein
MGLTGMNKPVDNLGIAPEQLRLADKSMDFVQRSAQLIHRIQMACGYEKRHWV